MLNDIAKEPVHRVLLSYTGTLDKADFDQRCAAYSGWYHSYYFDNGFYVRGDYDIGADAGDYGFPVSMEGMTVLDIGSGAGWFSHYFEQKGAQVTAVDARGYEAFDVYGRWNYPTVDRAPDRMEREGPVYYSAVNEGFWIMKDILGSRVSFANARVYDVCPELLGGRTFDLVFLGALLCHLRDPIGALMAARSVCHGRVVASTPVVLGEPEGEVAPRQYLPYTEHDRISWWLPNEACFRHWFLAAGFRNVDMQRQVRLHGDIPRRDATGRVINGGQLIRVGSATV